jgi:SAM-dependent methyltransferase
VAAAAWSTRQIWTERAPAWRRWQHEFTWQYREATALTVRALALAPGMRVLDLACATGDVAAALARAVGSGGRVAAVDLVPEMLAATRERAAGAGLATVSVQQADAHALPFADGAFDAVACRLAITLFPEAPRALAECRRVLRPGGRLAVLAWGSPRCDTLLSVRRLIASHAAPSALAALPDPLRYARPGSLSAALCGAGFRRVAESERALPFPWHGSPEGAWQGLHELQPAVRHLFAGVPPEERSLVRRRVLRAIEPYFDGRQVNFTGVVVLGTGVR